MRKNMKERDSRKPWPSGFYPLSIRGKDDDGGWLQGSRGRVVTDSEALWYDDQSRVISGEWKDLDGYSAQVNLLATPGTYQIDFKGSARGECSRTVVVLEPERECVPYCGGIITVRASTWDTYITKENSYRALEMSEADVVADLGAHIGAFTLRALAAGVSRVVAYEPEWENCDMFETNTRVELFSRRVQLVRACVVADDYPDDSVQLWIDAAGDGDIGRTALHSIVRGRGARLACPVPAVRWSNVLNEIEPTVLKVDVEGAELTYDWSRVPSSVKQVAVELERARQTQRDAHANVQDALLTLGFEIVSTSSGWSTVQVWKRT